MKEGRMTAEQLLNLLTEILGQDAGSKSRIRANYAKFKPKMADSDARLFAAVSFLRRFLDDSLESEET
jgi:hypothetical protein